MQPEATPGSRGKMAAPLPPSSLGAAPFLPIGELSRRTGCNIDTIRFYEKVGVLPKAARSSGGHRIYSLAHQQRLAFVCRARGLGFTLKQVRALLRLSDQRNRPCSDAQRVAGKHLAEVRSRIADLRAVEAALKALIAQCGQGEDASCPLLEALSAN